MLCAIIRIGRLEHRKVDSVADHPNRISPQIGLLHKPRQPLGRRDNGQAFHAAEPFFLPAVHTPRVVGQALGIAPMERAPPTVGFPFVASRHVEIRAMPRKRPAVVQRPDHGNVFLLDIPEQHRQIDIPAVQIVQVDHVGLQLPQPADQPRSSEGGKMPFQSRQSAQEMVQTVLEKRPDVKMLCVLGGLLSLPLSRDGVDREAVLLSAVRNLQHDVSRTAVIRGVDLNNRFSHSLPLHSARPMEQPLAVSRISRQTALFFASS